MLYLCHVAHVPLEHSHFAFFHWMATLCPLPLIVCIHSLPEAIKCTERKIGVNDVLISYSDRNVVYYLE